MVGAASAVPPLAGSQPNPIVIFGDADRLGFSGTRSFPHQVGRPIPRWQRVRVWLPTCSRVAVVEVVAPTAGVGVVGHAGRDDQAGDGTAHHAQS